MAINYTFVTISDRFASWESPILAHSLASTTFATVNASISSASTIATTYSTATKYGNTSGFAQQLLYPATSMARGDEPTVSVPNGTTTTSTILGSSGGPTTISRFTIIPVPEPSDDDAVEETGEQETASEEISDTRKEELYLISELSKMQPNVFEVSEEEDGTHSIESHQQTTTAQQQSSESTSTSTTSCTSSATTSSSTPAPNIYPQMQSPCQQTLLVIESAEPTNVITSGSTTSTTSSSSTCINSSEEIYLSNTIKLYRKHKPSMMYQEYKV